MPTRTKIPDIPAPILRVTKYDQVSAFLFAFIAALVVIVSALTFAWYASRAPKPREPVAVELLTENTGGSEEGVVGETLRVDSPLEANPDAGSADLAAEEPEPRESLDNVLGLTDVAVTQTQLQFDLGTRNVGNPGSAQGTGRRPLGSGPGTGGGFPREQRWLVKYADQLNLDEYARQLDFFGIEFGAIVDGKLVYLSKLASPRPTVRTESSGAEEKRLYMTWQGGSRKQADLQLFQKAGIAVGNGVIFQFYPKDTEDRLARLELAYRNRRANDIRRTYFTVHRIEGGYEFTVAHQTYLK